MRASRPSLDRFEWYAGAATGATTLSAARQNAAHPQVVIADATIRRVLLLFWGQVWEDAAERRQQIADAFEGALAEHTAITGVDGTRESVPVVEMSVISTATHTSPADPPELLVHSDVTALVANLMSARPVAMRRGSGATLYCVVLPPNACGAEGNAHLAYTAYRENARDVHCGWLACHEELGLLPDCARKFLAAVESALLAGA
ncbi:MAG TPA: hypothetical protein VGR88_01975 [Ktedonobacterales bacterium]|nr:hypothetical protein [Ktedonobacterales bacterium]